MQRRGGGTVGEEKGMEAGGLRRKGDFGGWRGNRNE